MEQINLDILISHLEAVTEEGRNNLRNTLANTEQLNTTLREADLTRLDLFYAVFDDNENKNLDILFDTITLNDEEKTQLLYRTLFTLGTEENTSNWLKSKHTKNKDSFPDVENLREKLKLIIQKVKSANFATSQQNISEILVDLVNYELPLKDLLTNESFITAAKKNSDNIVTAKIAAYFKIIFSIENVEILNAEDENSIKKLFEAIPTGSALDLLNKHFSEDTYKLPELFHTEDNYHLNELHKIIDKSLNSLEQHLKEKGEAREKKNEEERTPEESEEETTRATNHEKKEGEGNNKEIYIQKLIDLEEKPWEHDPDVKDVLENLKNNTHAIGEKQSFFSPEGLKDKLENTFKTIKQKVEEGLNNEDAGSNDQGKQAKLLADKIVCSLGAHAYKKNMEQFLKETVFLQLQAENKTNNKEYCLTFNHNHLGQPYEVEGFSSLTRSVISIEQKGCEATGGLDNTIKSTLIPAVQYYCKSFYIETYSDAQAKEVTLNLCGDINPEELNFV